MTPLAASLARRIAAEGPITVAEFMAAALTHPRHGYYMTRDPLGRAGDFVTAPEVSQMFGELLGLWCAVVWQAMGAPARFHLVELGPGRGTLMADAMRAARAVPGFRHAAELHLVEVSPVFRAFQRRAMDEIGAGRAAHWHDDLATVPEGPTLLLANEFFDALPVRQFKRTPEGWREILVDAAAEGLRFVLSTAPAPTPLVPESLAEAPEDAVAEVSPAAFAMAHAIGKRLTAGGGAALVIDYGHLDHGAGETLQAVRAHAYADVLAEPGMADITAHVDFAALGEAAAAGGARIHGPTTQAAFLDALGLRQRGEALLAAARPDQQDEIQSAYRRLVHPEEMGTLFKVLGLSHPGLADLPGLA